LLSGDEIGRTQRGNNNAYCQDNEVSWLDWDHVDESMLAFVRNVLRLRTEHPVFRRRRWFQGQAIHGSDVSDIGWFTPDGELMTEGDWNVTFAKSLGVFLNGEGIHYVDARGQRVRDESFYVIFNANHDPMTFTLPGEQWGKRWHKVLDTADDVMGRDVEPTEVKADEQIEVEARSLMVFLRVDPAS
jgi:isoamylase